MNFRASLQLQKPDGTQSTIQVRGSNLTRLGASVISREWVAPGSVVFVDLTAHHLMGLGHIVYCSAEGLKYRIGMEFRSPLMPSCPGMWALCAVRIGRRNRPSAG